MGAAADDEARARRRRAYKTAWQRAQRAERAGQSQCKDCGAACAGASDDAVTAWKGFCAGCTAKIRARVAAKQEATRAEREAARLRAQSAPGAPYCPHCGGRDLMRGGSVVIRGKTKKRFRCRACGRGSYGRALPAPPRMSRPCPMCGVGSGCRKAGRDERGRQRYFCPTCGRKNTRLYPQPYRDPHGPFRHVVTFYLGPTATMKLVAFCNATGHSSAQAIRAILRKAAAEPLSVLSVASRDGRRIVARAARGETPPEWLRMRLPDLRSEAQRVRMAQGGPYHRNVAVTGKVGVALDDRAWEGLVRTMRRRGLGHQETARQLIAEA